MALDVGDRRIGIAVTDALNLTAQPLFTLHRTGPRADAKSIARFTRQHQVRTLVVGLPLNADGTESEQSAKTRVFAQQLCDLLPELEHRLLDERLTTLDAHARLSEMGYLARFAGREARLDRREMIDQMAAVLLLEAWMSYATGPALLPNPDVL